MTWSGDGLTSAAHVVPGQQRRHARGEHGLGPLAEGGAPLPAPALATAPLLLLLLLVEELGEEGGRGFVAEHFAQCWLSHSHILLSWNTICAS